MTRKDVLVIDGGVIRPPGDVRFNFFFGLPPGLAFACMAETMILTLEGRFESYSIGGNISSERVREIGLLAQKHGFELSDLKSFGKTITTEDLNAVRKARA
jgi:predicted amino acid dehydrogenase